MTYIVVSCLPELSVFAFSNCYDSVAIHSLVVGFSLYFTFIHLHYDILLFDIIGPTYYGGVLVNTAHDHLYEFVCMS